MKEQREIKKGWFGARYLYLDKNTRIRYGFTLIHFGTTYLLQRRGRCGWKTTAWTYNLLNHGVDWIIEYLKWYEYSEKKKKKKPKCLF